MRDFSGLRTWARTHVFRTCTALITLLFFGLCFVYRPELVTWWLRTTMRAIEGTAAALPYPWGDRLEVALKGFGGSFWVQTTLAILIFRLVLWSLAATWRKTRARRFPRSSEGTRTTGPVMRVRDTIPQR